MVFAIVGFTAGHALMKPSVVPTSLSGLRELLASAGSEHSVAEDLRWEPSHGVLDSVVGRGVWFRARANADAPFDLFHGTVRVAPEGQLIEASHVENLTRSPLANEEALVVSGKHIAYASVAFGQVQSITLLRSEARWPWLAPWLPALFPGQGRASSFQRYQVEFPPTEQLDLRLDESTLQVTSNTRPEVVTAQLTDEVVAANAPGAIRQLQGGPHAVLAVAAEYSRQMFGRDSVRHFERVLQRGLDQAKQFGYAWFSRDQPVTRTRASALLQGEHAPGSEQKLSPTSNGPLASGAFQWPPRALEPLLAPALPGEGDWRAAGMAPSVEAPLFYQTFMRPDPARPYARVQLIALDMRRLQLGMQAGISEPHAATGRPGRGALPQDSASRERLVAVFGGGRESATGELGMRVEGQLVVPPRIGGMTVMVGRDSRAAIGTWSAEMEALALTSLRQSEGVFEKDSAHLSEAEPGTTEADLPRERSALCTTADGSWIYAWGTDLTHSALAQVLTHVACGKALLLTDKPGRTGLLFTRGTERGAQIAMQAADPDMSLSASVFDSASEADFFTLLRRPSEAAYLTQLDSTLSWQPNAGSNPVPELGPAIYEARAEAAGVRVQLLSIGPGRLRFELTAGTLEPVPRDAPVPLRRLDSAQRAAVTLAVGLGHTTLATRYGFVSGGQAALSLRPIYATLVLGADGDLSIEPSGQVPRLATGASAVQLPELLREGKPTPLTSNRGERATRGGLCVEESGRLLIATADHDSFDAIVAELQLLGCRNVLQLDRGSKHAAEVRRGSDPALDERSETSWLVGILQPLRPFTFRAAAQ